MMLLRMVDLGRTVAQQVIHERTTAAAATASAGTPAASTASNPARASEAPAPGTPSRNSAAGWRSFRERGAHAMRTKTLKAKAAAGTQNVDLTTPPNERIHPAARAAARSYAGGGGGAGPANEATTAGGVLDEDEIGGEGAAFEDFPAGEDEPAPVNDEEVPSAFDLGDDADGDADEEEGQDDE